MQTVEIVREILVLVIGLVLVVWGLTCITIAIRVWLGKTVLDPDKRWGQSQVGWPDVIIVILKTVPWVALVGLGLIYGGLSCLDVNLSPGLSS